MKITMSHKQAALKIKHWYLFQYRVIEASIKGKEVFTLFDKIKPEKQDRIRQKLRLNPFEIPILMLTICANQYIINTSERFVKITPTKHESVYYEEFEGFTSYESLHFVKKKPKSGKTADFTELGLKKTTGEIVFWKIPSGNPCYFFWNITRLVQQIRIVKDSNEHL
jgi:hypothetical protein